MKFGDPRCHTDRALTWEGHVSLTPRAPQAELWAKILHVWPDRPSVRPAGRRLLDTPGSVLLRLGVSRCFVEGVLRDAGVFDTA